MLEMGPKPFELRISKRPGGRHFERYPRAPPSSPAPPPPSFPALPCPLSSRPPALFTRAPALTRPAPRPRSPRGRIPTDRYNWSIFSVFVDLAYFFQRSYNNKWLVVRTNHIAYYADVTETAPQEVLLLDRFTKVRPRRWPFFPVVAAPNPSWTHPAAHHRPQGDGLGPRPAGVQRLPRARRAHAQPASRPGPGQGHQHRAHSPKSVVFIRLPFPNRLRSHPDPLFTCLVNRRVVQTAPARLVCAGPYGAGCAMAGRRRQLLWSGRGRHHGRATDHLHRRLVALARGWGVPFRVPAG